MGTQQMERELRRGVMEELGAYCQYFKICIDGGEWHQVDGHLGYGTCMGRDRCGKNITGVGLIA